MGDRPASHDDTPREPGQGPGRNPGRIGAAGALALGLGGWGLLMVGGAILAASLSIGYFLWMLIGSPATEVGMALYAVVAIPALGAVALVLGGVLLMARARRNGGLGGGNRRDH